MRRLRGTPVDVFGWAHVRRVERELVTEYIDALDALVAAVQAAPVTDDVLAEARAIASLPDKVRGYEHLKLERAAAYRDELSRRLRAFTGDRAAAL